MSGDRCQGSGVRAQVSGVETGVRVVVASGEEAPGGSVWWLRRWLGLQCTWLEPAGTLDTGLQLVQARSHRSWWPVATAAT